MLKIEYIKTADLIPYANNPRKNDAAVDKVVESIREFGFKNPIIVDGNNEIIAGHTRLKAAEKLGMEEVPTIKAEDLTPEQVRAFRIADNKTHEFAEWDMDLLREELDGINLFTGFDEDELREILDNVNFSEVEEDDFDPTPPEEPKSKLGDIYQLGRHRLMCGDSTDKATVEKLMNGNKADIAFTSPPYGVNLDYNSYEDTFENTTKLVELVLPRLCDITEDYVILNWGDIVSGSKINGTDQPSQYSWLPKYIEIMQKQKWYIWAERIWKKPHARCSGIWSASSNRPVSDWEYIFTWAKNHPKYNERNNGSHFGIIDSSESSQSDTLKNHPGAFPVYIASKVVEIHTKKNGSVVDLFGGTGTTLIACEQLNRTCYMMELDPKYVDVIINRWEQYTGQKAVRLNG
jgi:DNA modification methylase